MSSVAIVVVTMCSENFTMGCTDLPKWGRWKLSVSGVVMVLVAEDDRRSDGSRWVCSDASRKAKVAKKHVIH